MPNLLGEYKSPYSAKYGSGTVSLYHKDTLVLSIRGESAIVDNMVLTKMVIIHRTFTSPDLYETTHDYRSSTVRSFADMIESIRDDCVNNVNTELSDGGYSLGEYLGVLRNPNFLFENLQPIQEEIRSV